MDNPVTSTVWTVTFNDDSGSPDAQVRTSEEEALDLMRDWIEKYWTDEMPDMSAMTTADAYDHLREHNPDFIDSCVITAHEGFAAIIVSDREHATILEALRHYEFDLDNRDGVEPGEIATEGGTLEPLTVEEIDQLCERVNS